MVMEPQGFEVNMVKRHQAAMQHASGIKFGPSVNGILVPGNYVEVRIGGSFSLAIALSNQEAVLCCHFMAYIGNSKLFFGKHFSLFVARISPK